MVVGRIRSRVTVSTVASVGYCQMIAQRSAPVKRGPRASFTVRASKPIVTSGNQVRVKYKHSMILCGDAVESHCRDLVGGWC